MTHKEVIEELMKVVPESNSNAQPPAIYEVNDSKAFYGQPRKDFDFDAEWEKGITTEELIQGVLNHIDTLPWND